MNRNAADDHRPTASLAMLKQRSDLLRRLREFFWKRDFVEVQTPVLSADTVVDRYIEPISVELELSGQTRQLWLQTSPEFLMKRLLSDGATAIFQIGPAFRAGEAGSRHNPEFTMVEWYRVGDSYQQGRDLLSDFCVEIMNTPTPRQLTYRDALREYAQVDPFQTSDEDLRQALRPLDIKAESVLECDRDNLLNMVLAFGVEPKLGMDQPEIVFDWPASQAALAKIRDSANPVAERYELYWNGIELANGYHELTDADELESRNRKVNQLRVAEGNRELKVESRLLNAMRRGLPECCGVAVGFDRLLMALSRAESIDRVMPFPIDRA